MLSLDSTNTCYTHYFKDQIVKNGNEISEYNKN